MNCSAKPGSVCVRPPYSGVWVEASMVISLILASSSSVAVT